MRAKGKVRAGFCNKTSPKRLFAIHQTYLYMFVFLNNQKKEVTENSIEHLLTEIGLKSTKGIAIAINDVVIPKTDWENDKLKENDRVTVIRATQGG